MQKLVKKKLKKICEDSHVLDTIYLLLLYAIIYYLDHYNMCLRLTLQVITTRAVVKTICMIASVNIPGLVSAFTI